MILRNLIYILQSEGYYFKRFLLFAYSHLAWWKLEKRQKIVWTAKARLLWVVTAVLFWSALIGFFAIFGKYGALLFPILIISLPFIIGLALLALRPIDYFLKHRKINSAARIIAESQIKVIGIAGSYGKTSTKEILSTILAERLSVIKTPDNINTDIGIAGFILENKNQFNKKDVFIVEMGAYRKGEIQKICRMVRPFYSILTGLNESHLERFGSLDNIIAGKFELPQNTQDLVLLNFDDENIRNNHVRLHLKKSLGISKQDAQNINAKENFQGLEFDWVGKKFETVLLAEHNITLILLCAKIAEQFSLTLDEIYAGVKNIQPIEHRLQPIYNKHTGVMVIDDSYNGNFAGIKSGVQLLERAVGRKVVLTPGLVELGAQTESVHRRIGKIYASHVDLVLLIRSAMTDYIIQGLQENGFTNYTVYLTTQAAHDALGNVLQKGDTILFQNDLTDNYF